ncbi:MAG: DUF3604 domain-containing protein, partial [bacterium]
CANEMNNLENDYDNNCGKISTDSGLKLLWGDIHRHSGYSRCAPHFDGGMWDHYLRALYSEKLDFYSLTDHVNQIEPGGLNRIKQFTEMFTLNGKFTPFYGIEQEMKCGHVNYYARNFSDWELMIELLLWARKQFNWNYRKEYKLLKDHGFRDCRILAVRHYHADGFPFEEQLEIDRDLEVGIEVVQIRGWSPKTVADYLDRGYKFGFIGSSDHASPYWNRQWKEVPGWVFKQALTGLWSEDNSIDAVFDSFKQRRFFATNGERIAVDFKINNLFMGQEGTLIGIPEIKVKVECSTELERVEILRDNKLVHMCFPKEKGNSEGVFEFFDENVLPGNHQYYIRVFQVPSENKTYFGEAWSSPIWVEIK